MQTSLGIWAFGPMITRFVPGGYQPTHDYAQEPVDAKVARAIEGLGDLIDGYEFHYPDELSPANLDAVRAALGPDHDIYAIATGKIQPSGQSKVVQPLYPGKVVAINVENGSRVAAGDVDNDGRFDLIVGPGAGHSPEVKVFSGASGGLLQDYQAYNGSSPFGVRVASAFIESLPVIGSGKGKPRSASALAMSWPRFTSSSSIRVVSDFGAAPRFNSFSWAMNIKPCFDSS